MSKGTKPPLKSFSVLAVKKMRSMHRKGAIMAAAKGRLQRQPRQITRMARMASTDMAPKTAMP